MDDIELADNDCPKSGTEPVGYTSHVLNIKDIGGNGICQWQIVCLECEWEDDQTLDDYRDAIRRNIHLQNDKTLCCPVLKLYEY